LEVLDLVPMRESPPFSLMMRKGVLFVVEGVCGDRGVDELDLGVCE
jgi:hypothetical protein